MSLPTENSKITYDKIAEEISEIREQLQSIYSLIKGMVDVKTAAKILNISVGHLYQLTSNKEIPFYKPRNKLIYFDVQELIEWIKQNDLKRKSSNINEAEVNEAEVDEAMLRKLG